ncbi:hypothetical protein V6Z11_D02G124100 [Gossypium hirsutum]
MMIRIGKPTIAQSERGDNRNASLTMASKHGRFFVSIFFTCRSFPIPTKL